jgi:hypothetical protein
MRATSVSPGGDNSGFALDALLCAVICRAANHASSAAKIVEISRPPGLMNSASPPTASGPLTRSRTASTPSGWAARSALAEGQRHLHRVAADPAGRAHHHHALARGDAQQFHRPERRYRRGGQSGRLVVADTVGNGGQRLGLRARRDRSVFGERAVRARHAENTVTDVQVASSRRNPFDDTCEVDAKHKGICRAGGQPGEVVDIERIDACVRHPEEK